MSVNSEEESVLIRGEESDISPSASELPDVCLSWQDWCELMAMRYGGPLTVVVLTVGTIVATRHFISPLISPVSLGELVEMTRMALAAVALFWLFVVNSTDPGSLSRWTAAEGRPRELDDLPAGGNSRTEEITLKSGDVYRWCSTCQLWRPPRCSHCTICNRCFLRYDHHCPWIGSCVGASNHRFFTAFVFFIGLAGGTVPVSAWMAYAQGNHTLDSLVSITGSTDRVSDISLAIASSSAIMGFVALCTTCYCGVLVCFGFASWVMLCFDTTTKERFGREHRELDCEETYEEMANGNWHREMGHILCGPVRCREH